MDFSKYPLERLVYYIAGIVPGFAAILIYDSAAPASFGWFFSIGFLGYRTKLILALAAAFVVGYTLTSFLRGILGAAGGAVSAIRAMRPYNLPHSYPVAPWRDPRWRIALRNYLGAEAPNDSHLSTKELMELKRQGANLLPEGMRSKAMAELDVEKINSEIDDSRWSEWYDHFHRIVLGQDEQDFGSYVANGLNINLASTSVYVLLSAPFVPAVRHWWCVFPACVWVSMYAAREYTSVVNLTNQWFTLAKQIEYLVSHEPLNTLHERS